MSVLSSSVCGLRRPPSNWLAETHTIHELSLRRHVASAGQGKSTTLPQHCAALRSAHRPVLVSARPFLDRSVPGALPVFVQPSAMTEVWTWGGGRFGELGHQMVDREHITSLPCKITSFPSRITIVQVAAGERASAAVSAGGELFTWGSGRGGRLGHGDEHAQEEPRPVRFFTDEQLFVTSVSIGQAHMGCVTRCSRAFVWGSGTKGCLGTGDTRKRTSPVQPNWEQTLAASVRGRSHRGRPLRPEDQQERVHAQQIVCSYDYTAIVGDAGELYTMGANTYGQLGLGHDNAEVVPTRVERIPPLQRVVAGSVFAMGITHEGHLYSWGYNRTGCLGLGDRRNRLYPTRVMGDLDGQQVVGAHATVGQIVVPTGNIQQGVDGPHAVAWTRSGQCFTWGTCHKGKLGNLHLKTLKGNFDELTPYCIGSVLRDDPDQQVESGYLDGEIVVQAVAGAMHTAVVTVDGDLYSFGCGSTGRLGLRLFDTGLNGGRSRMKCYVMVPTMVESFREARRFVRQIDCSRQHMIALVSRRPDSMAKAPSSPSLRARHELAPPGAGARSNSQRSPTSKNSSNVRNHNSYSNSNSDSKGDGGWGTSNTEDDDTGAQLEAVATDVNTTLQLGERANRSRGYGSAPPAHTGYLSPSQQSIAVVGSAAHTRAAAAVINSAIARSPKYPYRKLVDNTTQKWEDFQQSLLAQRHEREQEEANRRLSEAAAATAAAQQLATSRSTQRQQRFWSADLHRRQQRMQWQGPDAGNPSLSLSPRAAQQREQQQQQQQQQQIQQQQTVQQRLQQQSRIPASLSPVQVQEHMRMQTQSGLHSPMQSPVQAAAAQSSLVQSPMQGPNESTGATSRETTTLSRAENRDRTSFRKLDVHAREAQVLYHRMPDPERPHGAASPLFRAPPRKEAPPPPAPTPELPPEVPEHPGAERLRNHHSGQPASSWRPVPVTKSAALRAEEYRADQRAQRESGSVYT